MKKHYLMKKNTTYLGNKGATMIAAIIIMTILIVFTFSLTLIAYTLYASQNKNVASMKCEESANTLSLAIQKELGYVKEGDDDDKSLYPEKESYLYRYLRYNICQDDKTWPYYVSDSTVGHTRTDACRYFTLLFNNVKTETVDEEEEKIKTVEGMPGRTEVCIYWMLPENSGIKINETGKDKLNDKNGIRLFIEVTCEAASQSYTVKREYKLVEESYGDTGIEAWRKNYISESLTDNSNEMTNPLGCSIDTNRKWTWNPVVGE